MRTSKLTPEQMVQLRRKAEARRYLGDAEDPEVVKLLERALATARAQDAKSLELRAAFKCCGSAPYANSSSSAARPHHGICDEPTASSPKKIQRP